MPYTHILFDLDGTLTDPGEGIVNSIHYALKKMGIEEPDREALKSFIGPPLRESFSLRYGFSKEEAEQAVAFYREYFEPRGMFENAVYAGIPGLLTALQERNACLLLATSKPLVYARKILEYFSLSLYFHDTFGSNLDGSLTDKGELISLILSKFNTIPRSSFVMIGDRAHDSNGAKKNAIDSIGVLWGYGTKDELEKAGTHTFAATPDALLKLLV